MLWIICRVLLHATILNCAYFKTVGDYFFVFYFMFFHFTSVKIILSCGIVWIVGLLINNNAQHSSLIQYSGHCSSENYSSSTHILLI